MLQRLDADVMHDHILSRLPFSSLVALFSVSRACRAWVTSMPEPARLASAQLSLAPAHPACHSQDVRAVLLQQYRLYDSLAAGRATLRPAEHFIDLEEMYEWSSDLRYLANVAGRKLSVVEIPTGAAVLEHVFAEPWSHVVQSRFSLDSSMLMLELTTTSVPPAGQAAIFKLGRPQAEPVLVPLSSLLGSQCVKSLTWAPSAGFFVAVISQAAGAASAAVYDASGCKLSQHILPAGAQELHISPNSELLLWIVPTGLQCLELASGQRHHLSLEGFEGFDRRCWPAWVQGPASPAQQLIVYLGRSRTLLLVSAPALAVLHVQEVEVAAVLPECWAGGLVVLRASSCLLVYRVEHDSIRFLVSHCLLTGQPGKVTDPYRQYLAFPCPADGAHGADSIRVASFADPTLAAVCTLSVPPHLSSYSLMDWTTTGFLLMHWLPDNAGMHEDKVHMLALVPGDVAGDN